MSFSTLPFGSPNNLTYQGVFGLAVENPWVSSVSTPMPMCPNPPAPVGQYEMLTKCPDGFWPPAADDVDSWVWVVTVVTPGSPEVWREISTVVTGSVCN